MTCPNKSEPKRKAALGRVRQEKEPLISQVHTEKVARLNKVQQEKGSQVR